MTCRRGPANIQLCKKSVQDKIPRLSARDFILAITRNDGRPAGPFP
jgi:hypothetical protein